MKVLFFSAFTPHEMSAAEKNTKIMLTKFAPDIQVDFVCLKYNSDPEYRPSRENVRILKRLPNPKWLRLINALCLPFFHHFFSARLNPFYLLWLKRTVAREKYDVVVFDHSQLFLYAKWLGGDSRKVLIAHDVIIQRISRSSNSSLLINMCKWSESYCIRVKNSQLFTFSEKDCGLFEEYYHVKAKCTFDYLDERIYQCTPTGDSDYFVMFGSWGRDDNLNGALWLAKEVFPLIDVDTKVVIIGKGFPIDKLGTVINKVQIEYMGFVDNPYPIISGAKALLSPLFSGAGIKVKVIESLACGVPVIGTKIAFEGIPTQFEQYMIQADDAEEFIRRMGNVPFAAEERSDFKKFFADGFQNETVPEYIHEFLTSQIGASKTSEC